MFGVSALAVMVLRGRGIAAGAPLPQAWLLAGEAVLYAGLLHRARPMNAALWAACSAGLVCLRLAWTAALGVAFWLTFPGLNLSGTLKQTLVGYPPAAYIPMLIIFAAILLLKPAPAAPAAPEKVLPRWAEQAIERQAGRTAEPTTGAEEPQILVSWAALLRQFPGPAVKIFEEQIERAPWQDVRLPLSSVLSQLEQGRVMLSFRNLLGQLPSRIARALAQQLSASMAEGVVELPLEEIVAQIPPSFFQTAKPASPPHWWTGETRDSLERIRFSLPTRQAKPAEPTGGKAR